MIQVVQSVFKKAVRIDVECGTYTYFRIDRNGLEFSDEDEEGEHLRIIGVDLL